MRRNYFPYGLQARNKWKQETKSLKQKEAKKKFKVGVCTHRYNCEVTKLILQEVSVGLVLVTFVGRMWGGWGPGKGGNWKLYGTHGSFLFWVGRLRRKR